MGPSQAPGGRGWQPDKASTGSSLRKHRWGPRRNIPPGDLRGRAGLRVRFSIRGGEDGIYRVGSGAGGSFAPMPSKEPGGGGPVDLYLGPGRQRAGRGKRLASTNNSWWGRSRPIGNPKPRGPTPGCPGGGPFVWQGWGGGTRGAPGSGHPAQGPPPLRGFVISNLF